MLTKKLLWMLPARSLERAVIQYVSLCAHAGQVMSAGLRLQVPEVAVTAAVVVGSQYAVPSQLPSPW